MITVMIAYSQNFFRADNLSIQTDHYCLEPCLSLWDKVEQKSGLPTHLKDKFYEIKHMKLQLITSEKCVE